MRVKFLRIKQLTALTTATSSLLSSTLSSKYWRQVFPGGNSARSVRRAGKYRSIWHTKILVVQSGIFGPMERAQCFRVTQALVRGHENEAGVQYGGGDGYGLLAHEMFLMFVSNGKSYS